VPVECLCLCLYLCLLLCLCLCLDLDLLVCLCLFLVFRGSCSDSCAYICIFFWIGLACLEGKVLTSRVSPTGAPLASVLDYKYRPKELEKLSWWVFNQHWVLMKNRKEKRSDDEDLDVKELDEEDGEGNTDPDEEMKAEGKDEVYAVHFAFILLLSP
jgi:hypothetical protein